MAVAAGYILADNHEIWGIGETLDEAEEDARYQGSSLDHDGEEMDDWIESLTVFPATAALIEAARQNSQTRYRELSGRVWGTQAEYEAGG